jgi:hypothetical protein
VTDEDQAVIDGLSDHAALTFLIGLVARADVWLEAQLRVLWGSIVGIHSPARAVVPHGIVNLSEQCDVMIREWGYVQRVQEGARAALREAREAHTQRNWVVHEMWLPALDEGEIVQGTFHAQPLRKHEQFPRGRQRTLDEVTAVHDRLRAATARISGLTFALTTPFGDAHMNEIELRMMEGRFTLQADGGLQIEREGLPERPIPEIVEDEESSTN